MEVKSIDVPDSERIPSRRGRGRERIRKRYSYTCQPFIIILMLGSARSHICSLSTEAVGGNSCWPKNIVQSSLPT